MVHKVMKSKRVIVKVSKVIKVAIWKCRAGHDHRDEKAAQNCEAKSDMLERTEERRNLRRANHLIVVEMAMNGFGWKEIGRKIGIWPSSASAIFDRVVRGTFILYSDGYDRSLPLCKQKHDFKQKFLVKAAQYIKRHI